ncbi:MAG: TetR family transcriptional regulator [Oscillatoriaceae cyanobacterium Prado104]|jgi:AcrR family transcriptional regulator|nr:TetR family transcriptional regulator [Oscillatoriaceae cyanobacterium Prado104]
MPAQRNPTRQRLIGAALELFASQGVTETTTKQIAELAEVNEVTLFRQFGSKHGLLLAVIEEAAVFTNLGQTLVEQADRTSSIYQALKDYANACLEALERVPEVVRSVVGEAGKYPSENRAALGAGFTQANRYVAEYFATVIDRGQLRANLSGQKLASLLNGMLLGYAVIEFTSEFHELWQDREDFLENLVALFLHGAVSDSAPVESEADVNEGTAKAQRARREEEEEANVSLLNSSAAETAILPESGEVGLQNRDRAIGPDRFPVTSKVEKVSDLPASLVATILQRAKKLGQQEYALAYVLFGAGLNAKEIINLDRSHRISDSHQQLLQVTQGFVRQVTVNQWIMGKRYGSYTNNPLTQWLKSRKDSEVALFLNPNGKRLSEIELEQFWQKLTAGLLTLEGEAIAIEQTQQTWCVEMLMRGINLEDMRILTGWDAAKLLPYARRAREKTALEQAIRLDRKV